MSKTEFWILNIVGGTCALLIGCDLVLAGLNQRLNQSVTAMGSQFNQAQQMQQTARSLVLRIAQDGQKEAALRQLLAKHQINVNLNAEPSNKPTP